jgi:hypothetical protein
MICLILEMIHKLNQLILNNNKVINNYNNNNNFQMSLTLNLPLLSIPTSIQTN